jgi:ferrochelatase
MQAGGREFHYIPCLNERSDWIEVLADIALENLHGWLGPKPNEAELAQSRQRALAIGAGD